MEIKKFQFNPFPVNTYVLWDPASKECAIIDPGCYWQEETEALNLFISEHGLLVKYILLTHLHLDHALSVPAIKRKYNAPFMANKKDAFQLENAAQKAASYGLRIPEEPIEIDLDLTEQTELKLGKENICVLEVPGHSPGSVVFYVEKDKILIVGDVLFRQSIGRADLPGGDYKTLISNIESKLLHLPDNTIVYSGHGPETTIGYEKQFNPFLS
ncbi:MAG: MBL fold metallo-hydrolase [Bacteroidales bacterium]